MEEIYLKQLISHYRIRKGMPREDIKDTTHFGIYVAYQIQQKNIEKIKEIIELRGFDDINSDFDIDDHITTILYYSIKFDLGPEFIKYLIKKGADIEPILRKNIGKLLHLKNYMDYVKVMYNSRNIYEIYCSNNLFTKTDFEHVRKIDEYFLSLVTTKNKHVLWKNTSIIIEYIDSLVGRGKLHEDGCNEKEREEILDTIHEILKYMRHLNYNINQFCEFCGSIEIIIDFIIQHKDISLSFCKEIIYKLLDLGVECWLELRIKNKWIYIFDHYVKYNSEPFYDNSNDEYDPSMEIDSVVIFSINTPNDNYLFIKDLCEDLEKRRRVYSNSLLNHPIFDLNIHYDNSIRKRKIIE